jgi:hypothetical protein
MAGLSTNFFWKTSVDVKKFVTDFLRSPGMLHTLHIFLKTVCTVWTKWQSRLFTSGIGDHIGAIAPDRSLDMMMWKSVTRVAFPEARDRDKL